MRRFREISAFLLAVLAVFFWRLGCGWLIRLEAAPKMATLHCATPLTAGDYAGMARREQRAPEPAPFVIWAQLDWREAAQANRRTEASVLLLRGDSRLLFPFALEDTGGALIDRGTARALFGDENAVGYQFNCMGRRVTVRGLLEVPMPTIVLQALSGDKTPLENVTVPAAVQGEFILRHGLEAGLAANSGVWAALAGFFCGIPAALACIWALWRLLRTALRQRRYPARFFVCALCLLALWTACVLWLLAVLPPQFIPPEWSDFAFWAESFPVWKARALELLSARKYRPDLIPLSEAARAAGAAALSCLALAAGMALNPFRNR